MGETKLNLASGQLLYGLDDKPEGLKIWIYAFQFLVFAVANSAVVPVIVGVAIGLDVREIATLVQRTFFFCSIASFLQVMFGHKYPIFEGPAGMWYSVFIILGTMAPTMGKSLSILRSDLQFGLLVAGALTVVIGISGMMNRIAKLFTPIVNGVFLVIMAFQLSTTIVPGMLGITGEGALSLKSVMVAAVTVATTIYFTIKVQSWLKSISVLIGLLAGWGSAILVGLKPLAAWELERVVSFPEFFVWGKPTFDLGIVITCILAAIIVLSNFVASLQGMAELTHSMADNKRMNRGVFITGIANLLAGAGSVVGFIPYASAIGLVSLSKVAARLPFLFSTIILAIMALFPVIGSLFAAIPPSVAYSILLVTFSQIIVMGIKNFAMTGLDTRSGLIIGISLMLGVGLIAGSQSYLEVLPVWGRYLLGNGLIIATILSLLLDNYIMPDRKCG